MKRTSGSGVGSVNEVVSGTKGSWSSYYVTGSTRSFSSRSDIGTTGSCLDFPAIHSQQCKTPENKRTRAKENYSFLNADPRPSVVINDLECSLPETICQRPRDSGKRIRRIIRITDIDPPSPTSVLNSEHHVVYMAEKKDSNYVYGVQHTITSPQRRLKVARKPPAVKEEKPSFKMHKNDYICGVKTTRATNCKRRLSCKAHTYEEKLLVSRSKPLVRLLQEEQTNTKDFLNKRRIAMQLAKDRAVAKEGMNQKENSSNHFNDTNNEQDDTSPDDSLLYSRARNGRITYPSKYYPTSATCNHDSSEKADSTASVYHNPTTNEIFDILKSSIVKPVAKKKLYVHSLSRSSSIQDKVAYLHYRLKGVENMSTESRVEAFFLQRQRYLQRLQNDIDKPEIFTPKQNI